MRGNRLVHHVVKEQDKAEAILVIDDPDLGYYCFAVDVNVLGNDDNAW